MKVIVGSLLALTGIIFIIGGFYLGIVTFFIGGIVDIINQVKAPNTDAFSVAVGLAKVIFFEVPIYIGWLLGIGLLAAAVAITD